MGLTFIEQVELLCDVHSLQVNEAGKDICNAILAIVVKNARQELTENLAHVAVADGSLVT
jgi:hypothetical protein